MKKVSRREFVKNVAVASAFMILPSCASVKTARANGKVNVAVIGAGGRGSASVRAIAKNPKAELVALCDVDNDRAAKIYAEFPKVKKYFDFRKMLDDMDKDIDAVVVATPDHMHFPISAWAMRMGKHVYCEKPLARTVWETRQMAKMAKKYGVKTQMGNQGHTKDGWRAAKELVDSGVLGEIEDVYSWTDRPIWPQGNIPLPAADPIPANLKYDLWLGVAPKTQYFKKLLPFNWRGLRNFGTGASGDMAVHVMDAAYSSMELDAPYKIESTQEGMNDFYWPAKSTSHQWFKNPRGKDGVIRIHWYDGTPELNKPKEVKRVAHEFLHDKRLANGTLIVGTKETVFLDTYGGNARLMPLAHHREMLKSNKLPKKSLPRSKYPDNPWAEWIDAILAGGQEQSPANFGYAAPLTEISLLNMCAMQAGQPLEYNAEKMSFTNAPEMNKYLYSLYEYDDSFLNL